MDSNEYKFLSVEHRTALLRRRAEQLEAELFGLSVEHSEFEAVTAFMPGETDADKLMVQVGKTMTAVRLRLDRVTTQLRQLEDPTPVDAEPLTDDVVTEGIAEQAP